MSDPAQQPIYTLNHKDLKFPLHPTEPVEANVTLKNENDKPILFKIKTSRPTRYSVKPKVGIVGPRQRERLRFVLVNLADISASDNDRFSVEVKFPEPGMNTSEPDTCWPKGQASSGQGVVRAWLPVIFSDDAVASSVRGLGHTNESPNKVPAPQQDQQFKQRRPEPTLTHAMNSAASLSGSTSLNTAPSTESNHFAQHDNKALAKKKGLLETAVPMILVIPLIIAAFFLGGQVM